MTVAETTKPEPLDRHVRADAIATITRALTYIAPEAMDIKAARDLARDVASETIDAFLIAAEGGART